MSQFQFQKTKEGNVLKVAFAGHIDEDATISSIDFEGAVQVEVDLEKVEAINSCGIREWIKWVKSAPPGSKLAFKNCPKVIVDQINMVSGFLPENSSVESFYVPYFSEDSGTERMVLFKKGVEFKDNKVFPPEDIKDEASGSSMEMDVIEAKYFKFIVGK